MAEQGIVEVAMRQLNLHANSGIATVSALQFSDLSC